jgi:metal-responsive CopG/Arc/MetJ family transcriptional regulator
MEKKDVRIQLVIGPGLMARLDEWRGKRQIWSRSEAIRMAIEKMLDEEEARAGKS